MEKQGKRKAEFSQEEKEELKKAYDAGMNSVSRNKCEFIEEVARKLGRDDQIIKVIRYTLTNQAMASTVLACWY